MNDQVERPIRLPDGLDHEKLVETALALLSLTLHSGRAWKSLDWDLMNLLFENGKLSGLLDFEATHLNYRVADFALAWRGHHDEVIEGYREVRELSELDWQLLAPCLWSWLFAGVREEIEAMLAGTVPVHGFEWQVSHLLRRSPLMGDAVQPYPGR